MSQESFHDRMVSVPMRHAYQLGYSMEIVSRIATSYNAAVDGNRGLLAHTMLDSFYVHIRLLADFLVRRTDGRDFGPAQFDAVWDPAQVAELEEGQRLLGYWKDASEYVVHFGRSRVPDDLSDLRQFDIGDEVFTAMATDALKLMGKFIGVLRKAYAARGEEPVPSPAETLYADLKRACDRLGLSAVDLVGSE